MASDGETQNQEPNPVNPGIQQAVRYMREMVEKYGGGSRLSFGLPDFGVKRVEVMENPDGTVEARWELMQPVCLPYMYKGLPTSSAEPDSVQFILVYRASATLSDRPIPAKGAVLLGDEADDDFDDEEDAPKDEDIDASEGDVPGVDLHYQLKNTAVLPSTWEDDAVPFGYDEDDVAAVINNARRINYDGATLPYYNDEAAIAAGRNYCAEHLAERVANAVSAWAIREGHADDTFTKYSER